MGSNWRFIDVSVFLSSILRDWIKDKRTPRKYNKGPVNQPIITLYTFVHPEDWHYKVRIRVASDTKIISVIATTKWLKDCWFEERETIKTNKGSQGRISITSKQVEMTETR
jgi:hypothetical protein